MGSTRIQELGFRESYVFVGIKGTNTMIEKLGDDVNTSVSAKMTL